MAPKLRRALEVFTNGRLPQQNGAASFRRLLGNSFTYPALRSTLARNIQIFVYYNVAIKPLRWLGSSLEDMRAFPEDARREAGYELFQVQNGLEPSDWKPMKSVAAGVQEIRIHTGTDHRVFYITKFTEAVYVIHAFEKRTRQTPQADIDLAKKRLSDLKQVRQKRGKKK